MNDAHFNHNVTPLASVPAIIFYYGEKLYNLLCVTRAEPSKLQIVENEKCPLRGNTG